MNHLPKILAGLLALAVPLLPAQSPAIAGLAHIAVSVRDLPASRAFYNKLGFQEAFHFGEGDTVTQSFLKVNDGQFIELYPATPKQPAGFLHLCFDGDDLNALYAFYVSRGLTPNPVRKARAGNLLFTMEGPEHQNIEYTQYLLGSLHTDDRGKHLGDHRSSTSISAVSLAMADREAARTFYTDKLAFTTIPGHPWLLSIPGPSHQHVLLETAPLLPRARAFFHVDDVSETASELKRRGVPSAPSPGSIIVTDPDGNLLVFQSSTYAGEESPPGAGTLRNH